MKRLKYLLLLGAWACVTGMQAENGTEREARYEKWGPTSDHNGWGCVLRAGLIVGGTTPLPLPAEIRSINTYSREGGGFSLGADAYKYFNRRWGMAAGLHLFTQGMGTGADVKDYNMAIVMGDDKVEGRFTGTDVTETRMIGFTLPVMATWRAGARWNLNLGPYFSYWFYRDFEGEVYDGYLREGSPVGQKITISRENPATYSFNDDMRRVSWGIELGVDFRVVRHMNVFGILDWGLSDVFHSNFKTVDFPMYPLYATVGVAYYY